MGLALLGGVLVAACDGPLPPVVPSRASPNVIVSPASVTLEPGRSVQLAAEVRDAAGALLMGYVVTWWTPDTAVVALSAGGLVTARRAGTAVIGAEAGGDVGYARVVVQPDFRLPLPGGRHWRLVTESGRPAACPAGEGGVELAGSIDCSHADESRYALDFDDWTAEDGSLAGTPVPVLAAADGVVRDVCLEGGGWCGPRGSFVTVDHPGDFTTIYGHLATSSVGIRRKDPVVQGQALGIMGASGPGTDVRLHVELRYRTLGSSVADVLDAFALDGRPLVEYRVTGPDAPFYPSRNGTGRERE